ncbi:MAG: hypothetical protein ACI3Z0_04420 [Candidatus Cryptobacteroides sp.]
MRNIILSLVLMAGICLSAYGQSAASIAAQAFSQCNYSEAAQLYDAAASMSQDAAEKSKLFNLAKKCRTCSSLSAQADKYYQAGNYSAAANAYKQLVAANPNDRTASSRLSQCNSRLANVAAAKKAKAERDSALEKAKAGLAGNDRTDILRFANSYPDDPRSEIILKAETCLTGNEGKHPKRENIGLYKEYAGFYKELGANAVANEFYEMAAAVGDEEALETIMGEKLYTVRSIIDRLLRSNGAEALQKCDEDIFAALYVLNMEDEIKQAIRKYDPAPARACLETFTGLKYADILKITDDEGVMFRAADIALKKNIGNWEHLALINAMLGNVLSSKLLRYSATNSVNKAFGSLQASLFFPFKTAGSIYYSKDSEEESRHFIGAIQTDFDKVHYKAEYFNYSDEDFKALYDINIHLKLYTLNAANNIYTHKYFKKFVKGKVFNDKAVGECRGIAARPGQPSTQDVMKILKKVKTTTSGYEEMQEKMELLKYATAFELHEADYDPTKGWMERCKKK